MPASADLQVQGRLLGAGDGVPALQEYRRVAAEGFAQTGQAERIGGIAEQQQADRGAMPLDQGVGCQCSRDGDQADGWMRFARPAPTWPGSTASMAVANANRQVVFGGEGFGRSQHALFFVEQDGVCVGAAGVNA